MKQLDRDQDYWQARAEAAERKLENYRVTFGESGRDEMALAAMEQAEAAERERDNARDSEMRMARKLDEAEATLAAVRHWAEHRVGAYGAVMAREVLAILDGEGEK